MAISQNDILNRAIRIANMAGGDANASPIIDSSVISEDLFSTALREAVRVDPQGNKRSYPLTFAAGEATLPDTVLEEYLDDSTLQVTGDANLLVSFESRYADYIRSQFSYPQLAYYTVRGNKICFRGAGQAAGVATSTASLICTGTPDIPTTITDDMGISQELADIVAVKLAEMMRGKGE